jgi:hypothetical protein
VQAWTKIAPRLQAAEQTAKQAADRHAERIRAFAAVWVALVVGFKHYDWAFGLGVWPWKPSLTSIDPLERLKAARLAAKRYGGGK